MTRRVARWAAILFAALALLSMGSFVASAEERPTAWVVEHHRPGSKGPLAKALKKAGFRVHQVKLDERLSEIDGLLAFGSFSSQCEGYSDWVDLHLDAIRVFVAKRGVVLQLCQDDKYEKVPPFLPHGMKAKRTNRDIRTLKAVRPGHPLLERTALVDRHLTLNERRTGYEMFEPTPDFGPLLVSADQRRDVALLEAAHGEGRIVLAGMALDIADKWEGKAQGEPAFRKRFLRNLRDYVISVQEGWAPPIDLQPTLVREIPFSEGSWTMAVLPDTQYYAKSRDNIFHKQIDCLLDERERLNLQMVLTLGDITEALRFAAEAVREREIPLSNAS